MALRILASVILLFSILFMPFWISVILAFASMAYFPFFLEAIFLFFLSDVLYGVNEARFFGIIFISSGISFLLLILMEFLKKKLKFYA